jgi:D-glycero-D-manno-heptose 1,7-bisphosphate phosphatase
MNKAIFLDKDGTLIHDVPYNVDPRLIKLAPGVATALRHWRAVGYKIIVISNQSGVARGIFRIEKLNEVTASLARLLRAENTGIDDFYFCPHHPQGLVEEYATECNCRKPQPGLIIEAAKTWNINLNHSWMIGDILDDVEAGNRAACKTILLDNGNETEWKISELRKPTAIVKSFNEAMELITSHETLTYA